MAGSGQCDAGQSKGVTSLKSQVPSRWSSLHSTEQESLASRHLPDRSDVRRISLLRFLFGRADLASVLIKIDSASLGRGEAKWYLYGNLQRLKLESFAS